MLLSTITSRSLGASAVAFPAVTVDVTWLAERVGDTG